MIETCVNERIRFALDKLRGCLNAACTVQSFWELLEDTVGGPFEELAMLYEHALKYSTMFLWHSNDADVPPHI